MILIQPQSKQRDMRYRPQVGYERPGLGDDLTADTSMAAAEVATARWVGTKLEQHYPGHAWHVEVQITSHSGRRATDGVIKIRLNGIMPANYWYLVKLSQTLTDPGGQALMRGAGELLERYGLRRGNFDLDQWRSALAAMPIVGRVMGRGHDAPLRD